MNFTEICKLPQEQLKARLEVELQNRGYTTVNEDGFLYAEGTVPVMLTAHMDTVHHDNCTIVCISEDGNVIMSPQGIGGDDRCGIYMALKILEAHRCSVLFTEDEEIGCVGARKFCKTDYKPAALNYIIEFDRKNGNDAVFYSCDNPEFTKFCTDGTGFEEASGSCSDISHIAPHLGVAAVNFSCGYYNPHTCHEYVKINEMERNIQRAIELIAKPCEKFEYIEKKYTYTSKYSGYTKLSDYYDYDGGSYRWSYKGYDDKDDKPAKAKSYDVSSIYDQIDMEAYYKQIYGLGEEPDWEMIDQKEVMSLEPGMHYLEDSQGNTYEVDDDYQYYIDKDGKVYYGGGLYPLAYLLDARALDISGQPVKYDEYLNNRVILVSYEDWEKVMNYYEKLVEMDGELFTDYAEDFVLDLESLVY